MALLSPKHSIGWLAAIAVAALFIPAAQGQTVSEYQVKAAFLYNFAKFVDWPVDAFKSPADPIVICLFGPNPFGSSLEDTVDRKVVGGRMFVVRQVSDAPRVGNCQILFVGSSGRKRFQAVIADFTLTGVLIVGESPGFAAGGGTVNFKLEEGRVRIEINIHAAERANLRISSKLLSLAEIVN